MKLFYLFLLFIFIIKIAELVESPADDPSKAVKYHGGVRYWTMVDPNGRTYASLNILKEAVPEPVKLLFPKEKNIGQILSDVTLYSPTDAEDECKMDNPKLEFKLAFDNDNWIRVEVIVELQKLMAYSYAKCTGVDGTRPYASNPIDEKEANLENEEARLCFKNGEDPFHSFNDTNMNMMELHVSGTFKCEVFLILPNYMDVEDEVLPLDFRQPVNATFAGQGEGFWWKSENNESLSDEIFFVERDVVINISNSTKALPYFLRIGDNQPYPSLLFNFDPTCSNQQFDLFINLRDGRDCRIKVKLGEDGIQITTKGGVSHQIRNATKISSLIFARGQSKAYLKAGLLIIPMEVCEIENAPDVPVDQFVLQISPSKKSDDCELAQIILPAGDVKNKIEVLLDRIKAAALIPLLNKTDNSTLTSFTSAAFIVTSPYSTTDKTTIIATGGIPWWWILGGVLLFVFVVAAIIAICFYVCYRRKQKKSKVKNDEEQQPLTTRTETTIPIEQPQPPKAKSKKETKEQKIGENAKRTEKELKNHYEELPLTPPKNGPNDQYEELPLVAPKNGPNEHYEELPLVPPKKSPPKTSSTESEDNQSLESAATQIPSQFGNSTRTAQRMSSEYIKFSH